MPNGNDIVEKLQHIVNLRDADLNVEAFWEAHSLRELFSESLIEIERLKKKCNDQAMILRQFTYEKWPGVYFISCEYGPKDANGLPEKIGVVPAYGLDWHQIYTRTDKVNAPGW